MSKENNLNPSIGIDEIGKYLKEKLIRDRLTLSEASDQCGVSSATLSRLVRQYTHKENLELTPDTRTITSIADWLEIPIQQILGIGVPLPEDRTLPDQVEAYLRADPNLNKDASKSLAKMFRLAYVQFSKSNKNQVKGGD